MRIIHLRTGPISVNTYIVYDENTLKGFVVDPGGSCKRILKEAADKGITIEAQLLTHGHFDHCGASKELQDQKIPVYIHEGDADKLYTEGNLSRLIGSEFQQFKADFLLSENQKLSIAGFDIDVLHTPGHSSGSACYVVENCIFSGDTLFNMSVGRTDFPDGNAIQLSNSIKNKLFSLEGEYKLYPGHDDFSTLSYERKYNPYVTYGENV